MSAIAGIFRFDGQPADRRDLERMMNTLSAHGPDRSGTYVMGPVGLGHLLMRITPEDSFDAQPVRGASGAIMVADLRLDNRDDLATVLGLDPQQAMVSPDAAIALAAWEKWGSQAWARLRGPFAAAIWDPRSQAVTLVRDPVGLRALCYYKANDFMAFATMPKGLFALGDIPSVLNKEKFADFLVLNHSDCETTVYRDVFRLHPAHAMNIDAAGKLTSQAYWGQANIRPVRLGSDQAYADAMRERLDVAVRRQLRTIHKTGCFLSGGLDSSAVAALAARALAEQGKRLPAYTQVPAADFQSPSSAGKYFDERPYVEAISGMIDNLDVTYVCSAEYDDFADLDRVFQAIDGPVRNVTNMGWLMQIYRLARAGNQRVLLGGDLGNLTVSWDGWAQAFDHLVRFRLGAALRQWQLLYRTSTRSRFGAFRQLFVEPSRFATPIIVRWAQGSRHSPINPQFARDMQVVERAQRDSGKLAATSDSVALSERLNMITGAGVEFRGEWEAGMLALYGIDLRDPTADLDVVEFCLGIPDQQYLAEGISRSIIRRAMWNMLPPAVLANPKRGTQAADWFGKMSQSREALAEEVSQLRGSSLAAEAIDLKKLDQLVRDWSAAAENKHSHKVSELYQFALSRGLASGRFLRLLERSNRQDSTAPP
jgi:asparagine synthase (glutamine-hydrolysing)